MAILGTLFGNHNERELTRMQPLLERVNTFEAEFKSLDAEGLQQKMRGLKKRLGIETLDDILPEVFALVREAGKRTLSQRHYDVQLIGGIVLHRGTIAEMKTGEGKTLAATLAVSLNALTGKGVHVVTVNDYLARRDAVWMGQIYHALGLSVGVITHDEAYLYDEAYALQKQEIRSKEQGEAPDTVRDTIGGFKVEAEFLRPVDRKEAYKADITYGTNNEFGFDYLRDNLVQHMEDKVQRGHQYAIVDEIDSILIDEARTPLIISAPDETPTSLYKTIARIVKGLKEEVDYNVDYKMRSVSITEEGINKVERALGVANLYDPSNTGSLQQVHILDQALKAQVLYTLDKDYVVKDGQVIIVDEFTGRLMQGRRYSEGLHQAIEAKEGVEVQRESRTLASITFQNYFRMYEKLAGMTGTALTSAEEFDRVYKLEIVAIPTNKPLIRQEVSDVIFRSEDGKFTALVRDIKERHQKGQPLLIGTTSIERNEYLSTLLKKEGIPHEVLNAKNHEREGQIIAQAGRKGAVTVATNMAGRGVDIILGGNPPSLEQSREVQAVGGLHVIGTERHEARRIDNQLRGRSGRQGDPGSSQFYLSLEDDIMRIFGGDRIKNMMQTLKMPEDQPIESKLVTKAIESAQSRIEGMNFDTRKRLLDYDEVLNKHRETIYKKRDAVLVASGDELKVMVQDYLHSYFEKVFNAHISDQFTEEWNIEELFEEVRAVAPVPDDFHKNLEDMRRAETESQHTAENIHVAVFEVLEDVYRAQEEHLGTETMREVERWLILRTIDILWMDQLDAMQHMRDSVRLRAYAQRDPLVEYKNEGLRLFHILLDSIESQVVHSVFKIQTAPVSQVGSRKQESRSRNQELEIKEQEANSKNQVLGKVEKFAERTNDGNKIGRNDPCPCGSGKKYKKCHGA